MPAVCAMSEQPKILLCQLWQRTSAKGNTYLAGYLGKASVVAFKSEDGVLPDGVSAIWSVYVSPGREAPPKNRPPAGRMGPRQRKDSDSEEKPFDDDLPEFMR